MTARSTILVGSLVFLSACVSMQPELEEIIPLAGSIDSGQVIEIEPEQVELAPTPVLDSLKSLQLPTEYPSQLVKPKGFDEMIENLPSVGKVNEYGEIEIESAPHETEILIGGGGGEVLDQRDELDGSSANSTIQLSHRVEGWGGIVGSGSTKCFWDLSPHIRLEQGVFEDQEYQGYLLRSFGGFRLRLFDAMPDEQSSDYWSADYKDHVTDWQIQLIACGGWGQQGGESRVDEYEADYNRSLYVMVELMAKYNGLIIPTRVRKPSDWNNEGRRGDRRMVLVSGFLHEISLRANYMHAFELDKKSNAEDLGWDDEWSDETQFTCDLHVGIGRMYHRWGGFSQSDLEASLYLKARYRGYWAEGFKTLDKDDWTNDLGLGVGGLLEIFHNFSLTGEFLYSQNLDSHRDGWGTWWGVSHRF